MNDYLIDSAKVASIDYEPGLERLDDTQLTIEGRRWAWSPVEFPSVPGVYRRVEPGRVTHWVRREDDTCRCDRATAIYGHFRTLLEYDEGSHSVTVHREALPPDLHRRTLTLCSGRLPVEYDQKRLAFGNVPADIAGRVISSLRNENSQ